MKKLMIAFGVFLAGPLAAQTIVCGVATGYPPYQFSEGKEATGVDVDWLREIGRDAGISIKFDLRPWDDVMALLRYGKLDCAAGMEITEGRKKFFDFTSPYNSRWPAIFVLDSNTKIRTLEDLKGRVVTGDKDSLTEDYLRSMNLLGQIRLKQTGEKEESMLLLQDGKVDAVFVPWHVGRYVARKLSSKFRTVAMPQQESRVGIAVRKGNDQLLGKLEAANQRLLKRGFLKTLEKRYEFEPMPNR